MSRSTEVQEHLYEVLKAACDTLDRAGIDYAVAGGIAAGFWGETRSTIDVDLVIAVSLDEIESVKKTFADDPAFLFDPNDFAFPDTVIIRVPQPNHDKTKPEIIAIDLLIFKDGYSEQVIARRRSAKYGHDEFWFCSPEDLILMKLRAGRHRDLGDIQTILNVRGEELDMDYIATNAVSVQKQQAWQELIDEWRGSR
jgi:hypothetical protein